MRHRTILFSLVAAWVLLAATPFAAADIIQDLTVGIDFQTCNYTLCMFDEGGIPDGSPTSGSASFGQLGLPWSYAFVTPAPFWWCDFQQSQCGGLWYNAEFDQGGTFTMTGPHGLAFSGIVTWGWTTYYFAGHNEIQLGFSGQWSNGLSAFGEAYERWWTDQLGDVEASLVVNTVGPEPGSPSPEPGGLILLGSGVLGVAGVLRRKLIH